MEDTSEGDVSLYRHPHYHHTPVNVNAVHKQKHQSLNNRIAITITKGMGTMPCAYLFAILAMFGFPGLHATLPGYIQWVSQVFIQLVALAVLANGQSLLSEHQEEQANETLNTTQKSFHDIEHIVKHLDAQDKILLQILEKLHE